ncbi:MAG TPA: effector-associated domain EAD1-containing protein [Anaerolineae bacterium]|nr:effector-associated domain EAD1-containing protein [Anaerolineae bacterium]
MSSQFTGRQYEALWHALCDAYTLNKLAQVLRFRLDKRLDRITAPGPFEDVVFELIGVAQREGWHLNLLRVARQSNPGHGGLMAVARQLGGAPEGTPGKADLEKMIQGTNSFLDVATWREKMGAIEGRVCRVEIAGHPQGTAFLLGPSAALTNYHVVEPVIQGEHGPGDVVLRFDYKRLGGGAHVHAGQEFLLETGDGWLLDSSRYSEVDLALDPKPGDPGPDELDYALLQVQGEPGEGPIGSSAEPDAPHRGWIDLPQKEHDFQPDSPLFIMQHPKGAALKLALETRAVVGVYGAGRRVRYRTNTEPGSSGSPVFDQNWNLVALHHSGDPASIMPSYNEGIPITHIAGRLRERGLGGYLGAADDD